MLSAAPVAKPPSQLELPASKSAPATPAVTPAVTPTTTTPRSEEKSSGFMAKLFGRNKEKAKEAGRQTAAGFCVGGARMMRSNVVYARVHLNDCTRALCDLIIWLIC